MIQNPALRKFLSINKIQALFWSIKHESDGKDLGQLSTLSVIFAIFISLLPASAYYLSIYKQYLDIHTAFIGIAACLAMIYRNKMNIPFGSVADWKQSLFLTHTAFALGCIPIIFIVLVHPEALVFVSKSDNVQSIFQSETGTLGTLWSFILGVAVWAGLTEEIIYRGLLISVIRRWRLLPSQLHRDIIAITASSIIFGLSHMSVWGPWMSLGTIGLGIGFGMAYIAIGELLLPVVVYHICFDVCSLLFSYFTYKF